MIFLNQNFLFKLKKIQKKIRYNFPFNTWWSMDGYPKTYLFLKKNVRFLCTFKSYTKLHLPFKFGFETPKLF